MSNVNVTRSGPEVMKDNPIRGERQEYVNRDREYRAALPPPPDFRVVLAWGLVGAGFLLVALLAYFLLWRLPVCWGVYTGECGMARRAEPWLWLAVFAAPLVAAVAWGVLYARHKAAQIAITQAEATRTSLALDRWGNPIPADLYRGLTVDQQVQLYWRMLELASKTKIATAPYETLPGGLNTYSPNNSSTTAQAALPAPEDTIALTPDTDWLRWVDRAPHLLLAGKTEAGKTTMASALLAERILAGDQILVLDPHYQPGKWFGIEAVSGISAILGTLPALIAELEARYEEFKRGKQTEEFERLTVLIDEVPAIVDQCIEMTASGRPKVTDWRWRRFAKKLGSEARKVRISVVLLSQSTLVQDLMINVQMKENFTRIGLGDQARPLLGEEPLPKRKQALFDLLRGQAHPAAMEYRGDFYLLDTSNVKDLAERNVRARVNAWDPDEAPTLRADPDDAALLGQMLDAVPLRSATQNGNGHVAVETATIRSVAERSASDGRETLVKQMRRQRAVNGKPVMSQDAIRAALSAMGIEIAQDALVQWCQEVDDE